MEDRVGIKGAMELKDAGFDWAAWMPTPTALEIIEAMPPGTHIKKNPDGLWYVWFELPGFQRDFRQDECPHKAAALAFIAWKKGVE